MAAITSAIIAGGAAVASAAAQRKAAKKAGQAQTQAADASLAEQRRQFDLTRGDFAGQRERGEQAGTELAALTGLSGAEAEQEALSRFQESPGQAFLRERQERALLRNTAATGGLQGGNVQTALQEQAFGIASQQLGERTSNLFGLANIGAGATATGAGIGANISGNIANTELARGDAAAQDAIRRGQVTTSGLANIAGAFTGSGGFPLQRRAPPPPAALPPSQFGSGGGAFGLTRTF